MRRSQFNQTPSYRSLVIDSPQKVNRWLKSRLDDEPITRPYSITWDIVRYGFEEKLRSVSRQRARLEKKQSREQQSQG